MHDLRCPSASISGLLGVQYRARSRVIKKRGLKKYLYYNFSVEKKMPHALNASDPSLASVKKKYYLAKNARPEFGAGR